MKETIVDVADMKISSTINEVLVAPSLGSCVALSIYDPGLLAGGIMIFMLPKMSDVNFPGADQFTYMFGDTGVPAFIEALKEYGLKKDRLQIAIAGGGQISGQNESFDIGQRNCKVAKELISAAGLTIQSEEIGGLYNRTLQLYLDGGKVQISSAGQEVYSL